MRRRRKSTSRVVRALAREFIMRNPDASNAQVVAATGASTRTVTYARQELIRLGFAKPHPNDKMSAVRLPEGYEGPVDGPGVPEEELKAAGGDFETPLFASRTAPEPPARVKIDTGGGTDPEKLLESTLPSLSELVSEGRRTTGEPAGDLRDLDEAEMRRILTKIARYGDTPVQYRIAAIVAKQKIDSVKDDRNALGPGPPLTKEDAVVRLTLLMRACGVEIATAAMERAFLTKGAPSEGPQPHDAAQAPAEPARATDNDADLQDEEG